MAYVGIHPSSSAITRPARFRIDKSSSVRSAVLSFAQTKALATMFLSGVQEQSAAMLAVPLIYVAAPMILAVAGLYISCQGHSFPKKAALPDLLDRSSACASQRRRSGYTTPLVRLGFRPDGLWCRRFECGNRSSSLAAVPLRGFRKLPRGRHRSVGTDSPCPTAQCSSNCLLGAYSIKSSLSL